MRDDEIIEFKVNPSWNDYKSTGVDDDDDADPVRLDRTAVVVTFEIDEIAR